jgi:hypothetical protein
MGVLLLIINTDPSLDVGDFFDRLPLCANLPRRTGDSMEPSNLGVAVLFPLLTEDSVEESGDVIVSLLASSLMRDRSMGGKSLIDLRAFLDAIISSSSLCP